MIRPKNETEDMLLSITKNCDMLIEQTKSRHQKTLEFKMNKPNETFHFNPSFQITGDWTIGLTSLQVYNSIFNITEENNKFELYKFPDNKIGNISYTKVRDEIEKDLGISDITPTDLQDDIIGPIIIDEYKEQVSKRMNDVGYMNILADYNRSIFQDFESFLRTEPDLIEDDIRLVLDEYKSNFISYEIPPGVYTFKDLSESLLKILQPEYEGYHNAIDIEFDDNTMKTKLVVRSGIIAINFDEKSFFSTILGFKPHWDYKHYNEYNCQKIINLNTIDKIHLKCDVIDGSIQNGQRQPVLFSFVLDKPSGYKVFCEPETIH